MRTAVTATLVAFAASATFAAPASADMADCSKKLERSYRQAYKKVDRRNLGRRAEGRNILKRGIRWRGSTFYSTCHDLRRVRRDLLNLLEPTAYPSLLVRTAIPPRNPVGDVMTPSHAAGSILSSIAQCESGGNPSTDTGNTFYGKYQFTWGTWASVGGSGNPAHASEYEQDLRAAVLYSQAGPGPWPVCGFR